jgi:hypothetical protein
MMHLLIFLAGLIVGAVAGWFANRILWKFINKVMSETI